MILFRFASLEEQWIHLMALLKIENESWEIQIHYLWKQAILVISFRTEKAMAPHSSTPAWEIPWTEEPGRLQSMRSLRVGHDWATSLSLFTFHFHALEKEMATHLLPFPCCSCLENPRDRGAWWAAVYGVAQSRTRLMRLSSSSSSNSSFRNQTASKRI